MEHIFSKGDKVIFTNEYGVSYPGHVIAEIADPRTLFPRMQGQPRYYLEPKPGFAHWVPVEQSSLLLERSDGSA